MIEAFEIEGGITLRGYRTSGSRPGPHVLITAGIHGSEYPGILAARKLRAFLSQADIAGTVTVLPLCNPTALKERAKAIFPEDGKNLNRMFPGNPDGSASEKTAWAITQLQDEADFYIDLHGGDLFEKLTPYVYVPGNCAPEVTTTARCRSPGAQCAGPGFVTGIHRRLQQRSASRHAVHSHRARRLRALGARRSRSLL